MRTGRTFECNAAQYQCTLKTTELYSKNAISRNFAERFAEDTSDAGCARPALMQVPTPLAETVLLCCTCCRQRSLAIFRPAKVRFANTCGETQPTSHHIVGLVFDARSFEHYPSMARNVDSEHVTMSSVDFAH